MKPKIGDILVYIFIVALIALSFLGLKTMGNYKGKVMVQVELKGELIESIEMPRVKTQDPPMEVRVRTEDGGYNIVRISADGVDIIDANCPDRLCVNSPTIKAPGQSVVCIPHKLVVKIVGVGSGNGDVDDTAS